MYRTVTSILVFILALAWMAAPASAQQQQPPAQKTLYQRIGGYDRIAAIVDEFGPRLAKDPQLKRLFGGLSNSSRMRNRQMIVDQLCNLTGGPCLYIGRDMKTAHTGIGITEEDWKIAGKHMGETLTKLDVQDPERGEFIAVIEKLRDDIVTKPEAKPDVKKTN